MTAPVQPDFQRFDPRTFILPEKDWPVPEGHEQVCYACQDSCTGQDLFTIDRDGQITEERPAGSTAGMRTRPACTACYAIWILYGYYGDEGLDEYLRGETRQAIVDMRESARHYGPGYHWVIAEMANRSTSREGVFVRHWRLVNVEHHVIRRLMFVPCQAGDAGAVDIGGSMTAYAAYERDAAGAPLTDRECAIAAAAVQWLGTNVGFAWLQEVLNDAGWELRPSREKSPL